LKVGSFYYFFDDDPYVFVRLMPDSAPPFFAIAVLIAETITGLFNEKAPSLIFLMYCINICKSHANFLNPFMTDYFQFLDNNMVILFTTCYTVV